MTSMRGQKKQKMLEAQMKDSRANRIAGMTWVDFISLGMIFCLAFGIRLFSVTTYESIIHEFDPWFNFRVTKYMVKKGLLAFVSWFDPNTWYPAGRHIGETTYPGLMATSLFIYRFLNLIRIPLKIREVCVFLPPFMASCTSVVIFLIARESWSPLAGVFSALLYAINPGNISRSVAGSYDNEAVAIFAMNFAFYLWIKASTTGSFFWMLLCPLGYYYMIASWGAYLFVLNLIALHTFVMFFLGHSNRRIYRSYCLFYGIGLALTYTLPLFINHYKNDVMHYPALGVFLILQVQSFNNFLNARVGAKMKKFIVFVYVSIVFSSLFLFAFCIHYGVFPGLRGRILQLIGKSHGISLVSSVAEHASSSLKTIYNYVGIPFFISLPSFPLMGYNFSRVNLFLSLYLFFGIIFTVRMIRIIVVLSPIICIAAGIVLAFLLDPTGHKVSPLTIRGTSLNLLSLVSKRNFNRAQKNTSKKSLEDFQRRRKNNTRPSNAKKEGFIQNRTFKFLNIAKTVILSVVILIGFFGHWKFCINRARYYNSNPSIILKYNNQKYLDDFREGYMWLRKNTPADSKVLSWWDYGYQITGMAKRAVYADGNTRDYDQIAQVGKALSLPEEKAYKLLRDMDVQYVLVIFGGLLGYSSDDIAKSYWVLKITSDKHKEVNSMDTSKGRIEYPNTLLYRLCYYRLDEANGGIDNARNRRITPNRKKLRYLEEAYTTEGWIMRIYRVKRMDELTADELKDIE